MGRVPWREHGGQVRLLAYRLGVMLCAELHAQPPPLVARGSWTSLGPRAAPAPALAWHTARAGRDSQAEVVRVFACAAPGQVGGAIRARGNGPGWRAAQQHSVGGPTLVCPQR